MFWVMMYFLIFGGGMATTEHSLFPTTDDLRKAIHDPQRQRAAITAHRDLEIARKTLSEEAGIWYAELRALANDRESSKSEWDAVHQLMDDDRSRADTEIFDALFQMRASMTAKEWRQVFDPPWYRRVFDRCCGKARNAS